MAEKMLKIDGAKLKSVLKNKKLIMKDVSKDLGYESTYMSVCCKTNKISRSASRVLDVVYGIKPIEYEHKEDPVAVQDKKIAEIEKCIVTLAKQQQAILSKLTSMQGKLSDISVKLTTLQQSSNVTPIRSNMNTKSYNQKSKAKEVK